MGKIDLCVCQGTCPGFKKMDIFNVLAGVHREKIFDYFCLHPQLCVGDGEEFLKVLLAGKQTDKLYIAVHGAAARMMIPARYWSASSGPIQGRNGFLKYIASHCCPTIEDDRFR